MWDASHEQTDTGLFMAVLSRAGRMLDANMPPEEYRDRKPLMSQMMRDVIPASRRIKALLALLHILQVVVEASFPGLV